MVPDPRYEDDKELKYKIENQMQGDISSTHRAPYPSPNEIGLPRTYMGTGLASPK